MCLMRHWPEAKGQLHLTRNPGGERLGIDCKEAKWSWKNSRGCLLPTLCRELFGKSLNIFLMKLLQELNVKICVKFLAQCLYDLGAQSIGTLSKFIGALVFTKWIMTLRGSPLKRQLIPMCHVQ